MIDRPRVLLLAALALAGCRADPDATASAAPSASARADLPPKVAGESWNTSQIDWMGYEDGLARAKAEGKPAMLVISATWCPHCKAYSHVFDDPRVAERAKDFVMIRVDADARTDVAYRYKPDGTYVPRTYFLASDGTPDYGVHAARDRFLHFYDEKNPQSVLGGMDEALRRQKR